MIQLQGVNKTFGDHLVLDRVSFEIQAGEIVAVVGPSGCGKSTLLRCMNGLEQVDDGQIWIDGEKLTAQNSQSVRTRVGMVFQNYNLFPHMTVLENLVYAPIHVKGKSQDQAVEKAHEILKQVGMESKVLAYPTTLSGGQKQRVAIARALMMDPKVILFDEPTSALDPQRVQEVLGVIRDLAQLGITIVMITHEMSFVKEVATRVMVLNEGRVQISRTHEYFQDLAI